MRRGCQNDQTALCNQSEEERESQAASVDTRTNSANEKGETDGPTERGVGMQSLLTGQNQ